MLLSLDDLTARVARVRTFTASRSQLRLRAWPEQATGRQQTCVQALAHLQLWKLERRSQEPARLALMLHRGV